MAVAGNHLYDISNRIDDYISQFGYGIVTDLVGHGIGTHLHEDPQIPELQTEEKKGIKLWCRYDTCDRADDQYRKKRCGVAG